MCRSLIAGGRRCTHQNAYSSKNTLLQAQKQYTLRRLTNSDLTEKQKEKLNKKLNTVILQISNLHDIKNNLGHGLHPFTMQLSKNTEKVLDVLYDAGLKPYIVGGSVRDALLGLDQKDIDIEVYGGETDEVVAALRKLGKVDEVGKSFGVFKIKMSDEEDYDISLPRKERKTGDGHKAFDVEPDPYMSLEDATARRDFTINALMYEHKLGYIIDKHGGYKDMQNKVLRHVSDAFDEDPLRVLRGVQMASRFGFTLHPDTIEKAKTLQGEFDTLATERVQIEFQKLYEKGKNTENALRILKQTEWDKHFKGLAEVNNQLLWDKVATAQALLLEKEIPQERKPAYLGAVIATSLPENVRRDFLSTTMVGDDQKNEAYYIASTPAPDSTTDYALRKMAFDLPRLVKMRDWVFLQEAIGNKELASKIEKQATSLGLMDSSEADFVSGNDIIALFPNERPGKWLGQLLSKVREAQYQREFEDKSSGVDWIKTNYPSGL